MVQLVAAWRGLSHAVGRNRVAVGNLPESIFALAWAIMAKPNLRVIGLVALATGVCAVAATLWMRSHDAPAPVDHRRARQEVLYHVFSRIDDPIIVLGDSNAEASILPRSACGHAIINAGLNGASTASGLGNWLAVALAGKHATAVIVALGTNDALMNSTDEKAFEARYSALLGELSKLAPHLLVLGIPAVETRERLTADMEKEIMPVVSKFNAALPDIAKRANATFLPLPEMPSPHTIDGIHLNADGYLVWDKAVMDGAASICG